MQKRMTLLAKKEGLSTADFRAYWAGPHAALVLGMEGIAKYTHNRVDKVLWATRHLPCFTVDGIVELLFQDEEAMGAAQASSIGRRHIPEDEPNFLKGWTLCLVDETLEQGNRGPAKVMVPFLRSNGPAEQLSTLLTEAGKRLDFAHAMNWTTSTARRERLWAEPAPPQGFVVLRFRSVAAAHIAFEEGAELRSILEANVDQATAYLVDELLIR